MEEIKFSEINPSSMRTFQLGDLPELIHVIKTGFENEYIVTYEDAYNFHTGNTFIGSKEEVEFKFDIKL